jgi:FtsH-binding integral membrane protein
MFSKFKAFTNINNFQGFNKIFTKRFSDFNNNQTTSGATSWVKYGLLGLSIGGLGYLGMNAGVKRDQHLKTLLSSGIRVSNDVAIQRTKDTLSYFGGGLCLTSFLTIAMTKSDKFMGFAFRSMSRPWIHLLMTLPPLILSMIYINVPTTKENYMYKHAAFLAFNSVMSFTISPLVHITGLGLATEALMITGGAVGGLAYVAYLSKNDAFLGLNGVLSAGMGALFACSVASIFFNSTLLNNIWLYGGLALFLAYVLYDVNQIKIKAERQAVFDPMKESLHIYLDTVNIFIRVLTILENKKRRN